MKLLTLALAGCACLVSAAPEAAELEPRLTFAAPAGERVVALTLDACGGGFDRRIFDALVDSDAKATIFVTDRWIRKNPQALAELKARPAQFQIENHGLNHVPAVDENTRIYGIKAAGSLKAVRAEVQGGAAAIEKATGRAPKWFRGATAQYSKSSIALIRSLGFRIAGYSINGDGGSLLGARETERRVSSAKDGDVIIAHINQPTHAAGGGLVNGLLALKAKGYAFVRLDDVEDDGTDDTTN